MSRVRRWASSRPHVLVVETPGGAASRLAVERWCRERGWPSSATPADADLLVVAGPPGALDPHVERLWDQLPGPRARADVVAADDVTGVLTAAQAALRDGTAARRDARPTRRPAPSTPSAGMDMSDDDDPHAGHDMGAMDMGGMDMSGMDMSGDDDPHAGHDMGGMDMPAGLAMADRVDDRDGLKLDVLIVPWGPALPWWPAGLVLTTVLQGDIVQEASAERLGDPGAAARGWREAVAHLSPAQGDAAVRLDALGRLLAVAGWEGARLDAERLRDDVLSGTRLPDLATRLRRFARTVGRSRALAHMSSGLRIADHDVESSYRRWLDDVLAAAEGAEVPVLERAADPLELLTSSLTGLELGTARLVVAALEPQLSGALHRDAAGV